MLSLIKKGVSPNSFSVIGGGRGEDWVRDANIHKVLHIMHVTSVRCDIKVRGWEGHGLSTFMC